MAKTQSFYYHILWIKLVLQLHYHIETLPEKDDQELCFGVKSLVPHGNFLIYNRTTVSNPLSRALITSSIDFYELPCTFETFRDPIW